MERRCSISIDRVDIQSSIKQVLYPLSVTRPHSIMQWKVYGRKE
jgi:hypothetical protein